MLIKMQRRFAALIAILLPLISIPLPSQTPDPKSTIAEYRVSVNLVEVDAVVMDKKGKHVAGLTVNDFQIFEDGKLQEITHFSWVADQPKAPLDKPSAEAANAPKRTLRREEVSRTIVFLVDDLHIRYDNMPNLTTVVRKFTDEQVQPGDLVSVMSTRSSMGIYEQLSSEHGQIEAALQRLVRHSGTWEDLSAEDTGNTADNIQSDLEAAANTYYLELYYKLSMATLARAIEGLQQMPGRKAVAFFSEGLLLPLNNYDERMPFRVADTVKKVTNLANQAGVAIYVIDPSGLSTSLDVGIKNAVNNTLAKNTGGKAVTNTNDLPGALGRAMEDMTGYYVLGYQPSRIGDSGRTHKIKVELLRKGLKIRSSRTLTSTTAERTLAPSENSQESREESMRRVLFSPYTSGDITLRLTPLYSASPPDQNGKRRSIVKALLSIDGRDLQYAETPQGRAAVVDFVLAAYDADNKMITSKDRRATIKAPADGSPLQDLSSDMDIEIAKPGPYQIRAAVRDDSNGYSGSASVYVEVPDFSRQRIMLSSVVLSSEGAPNRSYSNPATRTFAPAERVAYACLLYGAKFEPGTSNSKVEVELKFFHDGMRVFASQPIAIDSPKGSEDDIAIVGKFKLPAAFTPGEYALELIVRDKLAEPKFSVATQWVDLTVVAPGNEQGALRE
jgi:VWFA-related protein